jgi:hypothetical protein
MRTLLTLVAAPALCFFLTACPGSFYSVRPIATPSGLIFDSKIIDLGRGNGIPRNDPSRVRPIAFSLSPFSLQSGNEIVWQIESADRATWREHCEGKEMPSQITYGVTPPCYREVIPPKPLVVGQAYLMGFNQQFVYDHPIRWISYRKYRSMTGANRKVTPPSGTD